MEYFSSSLDLDRISCKHGLLRDVKRQTVKLITHIDTQQRLRLRGALPPMKHVLLKHKRPSRLKIILISLPNLRTILRRIIAVNIYCIEYVTTKPRVVLEVQKSEDVLEEPRLKHTC